MSSFQRPLPDNTQHSQQTNIHAPGGIRTRNLSRRAAADIDLRPRGHWDRQCSFWFCLLFLFVLDLRFVWFGVMWLYMLGLTCVYNGRSGSQRVCCTEVELRSREGKNISMSTQCAGVSWLWLEITVVLCGRRRCWSRNTVADLLLSTVLCRVCYMRIFS